MTSPEARNGTERCAEALQQLDQPDVVINLQGDALLTPPGFVEALIEHMHAHPDAQADGNGGADSDQRQDRDQWGRDECRQRFVLLVACGAACEVGAHARHAGVSIARADESIEALLGRADKSLYAAKREGRNRVHSG